MSQGEDEVETVFQSFLKRYNEARAFYDSDKMEERVATAQDLLQETSLPRYFRMKSLLLIAACVDSWYEAQDFLREVREAVGGSFARSANTSSCCS